MKRIVKECIVKDGKIRYYINSIVDQEGQKMNKKRSVTCKANCKIVDIHPSIPIIKLKWSKYVNK